MYINVYEIHEQINCVRVYLDKQVYDRRMINCPELIRNSLPSYAAYTENKGDYDDADLLIEKE